jgi:ADP-ribose pyrophosphatase YjhB (NUDIX family)
MGVWPHPSGHVDANEDSVDAVVREIREEVGLEVDIIDPATFEHAAVRALPPPFAILVEDVTDTEIGPHQHIDMVYVCPPTTQ